MILIPAFIDARLVPARLRFDENNSGSMDCGCLRRHPRHCGLGTGSGFIFPQTAHRSCDPERFPAPDENKTWALQSRLHQVSVATPSRPAQRLRPQSTDAIRPSLKRRKLVERRQPYWAHYRQAIDDAITSVARTPAFAYEISACNDARYKTRPLSITEDLRSVRMSFQ